MDKKIFSFLITLCFAGLVFGRILIACGINQGNMNLIGSGSTINLVLLIPMLFFSVMLAISEPSK